MADYLSLARLLQSGFWRARAGTFGECQTKTPPERAIWATRAGFREPSSAISSETRFLMKGSAQETHGRARGSSRNLRHEQRSWKPPLFQDVRSERGTEICACTLTLCKWQAEPCCAVANRDLSS